MSRLLLNQGLQKHVFLVFARMGFSQIFEFDEKIDFMCLHNI